MIVRLIDKLFFAVLLIALLQIPIVTDHYLQYLHGYVDATETEVLHYQQLARDYGYADTDSMLSALIANSDPLVSADARHKQAVIQAHAQARQAMAILQSSHYFEQFWYFIQPRQYARLTKVLELYQPSLPLRPQAIGAAIVTAICLYLLLWLPVFLMLRKRPKHHRFISH
ncbi:hypothetical protein BFC17_18570 [Alteromonas lipolytica]|uniref:DUF2937 domain-containing protein n=1 Tax=Alteromonas lipolytica TaxID=1856405 RepID=A0A1E8FES9_9ALTE|nr:hypothetical protein BFC17_18570 [Alteromonas lipolytica]